MKKFIFAKIILKEILKDTSDNLDNIQMQTIKDKFTDFIENETKVNDDRYLECIGAIVGIVILERNLDNNQVTDEKVNTFISSAYALDCTKGIIANFARDMSSPYIAVMQ